MIVDIVAFREYNNYKLKIYNSGITLLNGVSGTGKTTILRAIRWCLYGGSAYGEKYEVKIKYNDLTIVRKSKPRNVLEVTQAERVSNGDIATQIITSVFGPEDLFDLCCYMKQGDFPCPLMSSVSKERLYYLSKLAFHDDNDPTVLIEKIFEKLKDVKQLFRKNQDIYSDHEKLYQAFLLEIQLPEGINIWDKTALETDIRLVDISLAELNDKILSRASKCVQMEQLTVQLKKCENSRKIKIDAVTKLTNSTDKSLGSQSSVHRLEEEREVFEQRIGQIVEKFNKIDIKIEETKRRILINKYITARNKIKNNYDGILPQGFTSRELYAVESQHREYNENSSMAEELDIVYEETALQEEIVALQKMKKYRENKSLNSQYCSIMALMAALPSQLTNSSLLDEETKLMEMKRTLDLLTCPHCEGLVRYSVKNGLIIPQDSKKSTEKELMAQQNKIVSMRKIEEERRQLASKMSFYEERGADKFTTKDNFEKLSSVPTKEIDARILSIAKIKIISKPEISLKVSKLLLEYFNILREIQAVGNIVLPEENSDELRLYDVENLENLNRERTNLQVSQHDLQVSLTKIVKNIKEQKSQYFALRNEIIKLEAEIVAASEQVDGLQKEIGKVQTILDEIESIEILDSRRFDALAKRQEIVKQISLLERYDTVEKKRIALAEEKKHVDNIFADVEALSDLYENSIAEHHMHLQSVVDSINICIAHGVDALFPYPLTIALDLMPPSAEDEKRYKHNVEFTIIKKGKDKSRRKPEDIFSGGEMKRMILLIVIALNTLYKAPILMLDEMFASLDPEFREECLAVIKRYINDRLIISAEHYAEKGDYDYCIDVMPTNAE